MTLVEGITALAVAVQAIYAAATFHRDRVRATSDDSVSRSRRPILIVAALMLTTWIAVSFDYYDRHHTYTEKTVEALGWGIGPQSTPSQMAYELTIDATPLFPLRAQYKLLLITRVGWGNIDTMTDTAIEKSAPFSISGSQEKMAMVGTGKARIIAGAENSIEFYAVTIPNDVSPDEITSLADVLKRGGHIFVGEGEHVYFPSTVPAKHPSILNRRSPKQVETLVGTTP